jgi:signal transduction histidine kinase
MARHISDIPGMPVGMTDVGQDSTGYLWISSGEGLSRYDGFEIRNWGDVPGRLSYVSTGPRGGVLGGDPQTGLYEVVGTTLERIEGPDGVQDRGPLSAIYDRDERLWAAWGGRLIRREDGAWIDLGGPEIVEDYAFTLAPRDAGGVLVGSRTGDIWIVDAADRARRIAQDLGGWIMQLHDDPRGPVATVRSGARPGLVRVRRDGVEQLLEWSTRADGLARRGSTYWVAYTTGVWAVHDDGSREFLASGEGFTGFGNLAIDREGGLWSAGVRGLSHYPQPDTRVWTELSGLPHVYLRAVHPVPGGHVVTSWRGPMRLDTEGNTSELDLSDLFSRDIGCPDPWGGVWMKAFSPAPSFRGPAGRDPSAAMLVEWRNGRSRVRRRGGWYRGDLACDEGPDGSLWILADGELLEVTGPEAEPKLRGRLPAGTSESKSQASLAVPRDRGSVIAVFLYETCEAPFPSAGRTLGQNDWRCEPFMPGSILLDIIETESGHLWLAAAGGGVFERSGSGWTRVPGELSELGEAIALEPSESGGVWVMGWRDRWRVVERAPGEPPAVVERLGTAHGVPDWQNGYGLLEDPDGTIWIPLYSGLVRVPAAARRQDFPPPSVTLTRLVADGQQVSPDQRLRLRHGDHSLEVRWSALSFRDPTRVRYRMRLDTDTGWSVLSQPFLRLAGMRSGAHRLELGASLDGRTWSEVPAVVEFEVRRAWYARAWFVLLIAAIALAGIYAAYRLRLAHLLRLERQRTRIAMDLHDEMGAGLGSAGLLVGLLAEGELDAGERRAVGERVAEQIRDLGSSLADIVWSLRPGTETLDALLLFLRQRAADLFPAGGDVRVTVDAPDPCPPLRLALPLRRNLQWIAVEALHNAARHAEAKRIVVKLRPDGDAWRLSIRDDGRGYSGEDDEDVGSGLGRESMHRRASEIGAELDVRSAPGEGTEVSIRFRPGRTRS